MGLDISSLLLAGAVVLLGSTLQGSTGLGLAQVAVPPLALIDTRLVPVPIAIVGLGLLVLMSVRERHALSLRGLGWSIAGYLPASAAGAVVLPMVTSDGLAVVCGIVILAGVGAGFAGWAPHATPSLLATAGFASGFMGTTTGAAGPPMALAYQRREGPELRAGLSAFFVFGNVTTLTALGLAGQVHLFQLRASALLFCSWSSGSSSLPPLAVSSTGASSVRSSLASPPPQRSCYSPRPFCPDRIRVGFSWG